ncbi:MAG: ABC transporter substrate-binding protein, partial [Alphaproteobacteria bacterium]
MAGALLAGALLIGGAGAQDVIKIGASAPKTGPLAGGAAVTHWPALRLWVKTVNDAGGIQVGGERRKIELIELDDRTSNEDAVKNIQRLATVDKVDFIIAPYGTGINIATAPLIAKHGYPHIAVTAITDKVDEL